MSSPIARSRDPLYQTRDRPVSWTITVYQEVVGGPLVDLTGASASATLAWAGANSAAIFSVPLVVSAPLDATGIVTVSGARALTTHLPIGPGIKLSLTVTDSLGAMTDYVWPVIGEIP